MSLLGPVILAAMAAPDTVVANPLAPGLAGQLECTQPNEEKKTCRSLTSYQRIGAGYSNTALILISPNGPVTLEITAPIAVKGDAACGVMHAADIDGATIRIAGRVVEAADGARIRAAIVNGMTSIIDKEICVTYQTTPDGLIEHGTVDGVREPKGDQRIKWVAPGDGYSVAP